MIVTVTMTYGGRCQLIPTKHSGFFTILHADPAGETPGELTSPRSIQPHRRSSPCADSASWMEIFSGAEIEVDYTCGANTN